MEMLLFVLREKKSPTAANWMPFYRSAYLVAFLAINRDRADR